MSFTFRCVDAAADAPLLHSWVTQPYASFWGMLSSTVDGVVEEYRPSESPLAGVYAVQDGDIGMHLLVAPPSGGPQPGYTAAVMDAVLDRLFQKPGVERVVVEPDARNAKIHVLNGRLGFQPAGVVALPDKEALLSFCTREDYLAARAALRNRQDPSPELSTPIHQGAAL